MTPVYLVRGLVPALVLLTLTFRLSAERPTLALWPGEPPDETREIGPERELPGKPFRLVTDVTQPTLELWLPPEERRNGTLVMICPGGGHHVLAIEHEGTEVAEWLNSLGVSAAVLKYRVPFRDPEHRSRQGLQDAQRAIRLLRRNAPKWKISPDRIGILGFSAGGELAGLAATRFERPGYASFDALDAISCRPDFAVLIYPGGLYDRDKKALNESIQVPGNAPPIFFAHAADDRVNPENSFELFAAFRAAGVPAELHLFEGGGHGYGLRRSRFPVTGWPALCTDWMRFHGWLEPAWITGLARRIATAAAKDDPLPQISVFHPGAKLAEGYAAQSRWVGTRLDGQAPAGFKAGLVTQEAQQRLGIGEPLFGVLFKEGLSPADPAPVILSAAHPGLLIETEIGFRFHQPVRYPVQSIRHLREVIDAVLPVIELPGGRRETTRPTTAADLAAANVGSHSFIVGSPKPLPAIDADSVSVHLKRDGQTLHQAKGKEAWTGQWETLIWMVNTALAQGYEIEPGQILITGALGQVQPGAEGNYKADFGSLGTIRFRVE